MRILVTNDDGIHARGLWAVVEALRSVGEVMVVAPDREQSGVGSSVTLHNPVRATEVVPAVPGTWTYAVEGTPADSVILALESLVGNVDLVVAGINSGANLGEDVLMSGTMGAALQGYFRGIPSLAVSVTSLNAKRFEAAAQLLIALAQRVGEDFLPKPVLLNVNLPPVTPEQIGGIDVTRLARRTYADTVRQGDDGKRKYYWITRTRPAWEMEEGTDVWSVLHRRVSITPLQTDMTSSAALSAIAGLPQKLLQVVPRKPTSS
ncbi:5'/3'-nucleotidase SurE [Chloroflexota bacterium]